VLLKIVYLLTCRVLGLAVLVFRGDRAKDAELLVLRHENAVLRRHAGRVWYEPGDRVWFAAVARLLPRRCWTGIFPVTPATLLAWHRKLVGRKYDTSKAAPARPRAGALAGKRGAGSSRLLRRARQHRRCWDLPSPGGSLLAACTSLPEPAAPPDLAEDESPHRPVAAACPHRASPTQRALRRQDPRQEPDAVVPHVGICPGGRPY